MIGSLSQLIRGAAILGIEDGSDQITRDLLEAAPVGYAAGRRPTARPGCWPRFMPIASTGIKSPGWCNAAARRG